MFQNITSIPLYNVGCTVKRWNANSPGCTLFWSSISVQIYNLSRFCWSLFYLKHFLPIVTLIVINMIVFIISLFIDQASYVVSGCHKKNEIEKMSVISMSSCWSSAQLDDIDFTS